METHEDSEDYGFSLEEIEAMIFDGVAAGVCTCCNATTTVEPDAEGYDCEECGGEGTVHSVLVLLEYI